MKKSMYRVKVTLKGSRPKIWRRLLVSPDLLLSDFHKVIQTAMGWENEHLHQFIKDRRFYAPKLEDDIFWDTMDNKDYSGVKIRDLLKAEKETIVYEYDFGDGWGHDIRLEKILDVEDEPEHPVCLDGQMNCPPEDCGGIWGYYQMLEILRDPAAEEHETWKEWLGSGFDPEFFDKEEVNQMLKEKNFGCIDLF